MILAVAALLALQDPSYETTVLETGTFTHHIEARDLNDAIQVAAKIPSARIGAVEVRPIMMFE